MQRFVGTLLLVLCAIPSPAQVLPGHRLPEGPAKFTLFERFRADPEGSPLRTPSGRIEITSDVRQREQRFQLGGEGEPAGVVDVVQRLDTDGITNQRQLLP